MNGSVLITGGTGLVGSSLTEELIANGYSVIILTRDPSAAQSKPGITYAKWDPAKGEIDEGAVRNAIAVINLAGAGVAEKRWTAKRKKEIVSSRVQSGELLVKAIQNIPNNIKTVISASAIGWYGPDKPGINSFTEDLPAANSFLSNTCEKWEAAIKPVTAFGKRLVIFRIGIVLAKNGGAYPKMALPLKFRMASWFGNGKQVISWIHIKDLCRLFVFALENEAVNGIYNAVADLPVSNKKFIQTIAKEKGGVFVPLPVPAPALKIGLGEMSIELLKSATVSNKKIKDAGFRFQFPDIASAAHELES